MPGGSIVTDVYAYGAIYAPSSDKHYIAVDKQLEATINGVEYTLVVPTSTTPSYNNAVTQSSVRVIPQWDGQDYLALAGRDAKVVVLEEQTTTDVSGLPVYSLTPTHFEYKGDA